LYASIFVPIRGVKQILAAASRRVEARKDPIDDTRTIPGRCRIREFLGAYCQIQRVFAPDSDDFDVHVAHFLGCRNRKVSPIQVRVSRQRELPSAIQKASEAA
jgi:hypothetical protein